MEQPKQLTPRQALFLGLFAAGAGLNALLAAFGAIPLKPTDAPPWVLACGGATFILLGAALIVSNGIAGRVGPDGDLPAGTSVSFQLTQYVLGAGIVGCLIAVLAWVAFGPGPRHFTTTLPFVGTRPSQGEISGRILFGLAAVLAVAFLIAATVRTVRRIRRR
jgi:hypothetical protein